MWRAIRVLAILMFLVVSYSSAQKPPDQKIPENLPENLKRELLYMSGGAARALANALGITEINGKPLAPDSSASVANSVPALPPGNSLIFSPNGEANNPTVAVDPAYSEHLVAASNYISFDTGTQKCAAYTSSDGGKSWMGPITLPVLNPDTSLGMNPVVAFAPDGDRVYVAYQDVTLQPDPNCGWFWCPPILTYNIGLTYSDDGGLTWAAPVLALAADPNGFKYDKPWIATPKDLTDGDFVYVTASRFDDFFPYLTHVAFTRSDARGAADSWSTPVILESTPDTTSMPFPQPQVLVQGARPAAGHSGDVIVAWYNSNGPGIAPGIGAAPPEDPLGWLYGSFLIRIRYSSDHGASFGPIVNAAVDSFETPQYLGPWSAFFRFWQSMFPSIRVAANGSAHIVYTHDPNDPFLNPEDAEDGDVRYITSSGPPYETWSAPETVNDDGLARAQGFPSIEVLDSSVYVTFLDTRLSAYPLENALYDVFGAQKEIGATGWENFRVTDASSASPWLDWVIQDYFGLAANGSRIYALWSDRRRYSEWDQYSDVYGQAYSPTPTVSTISPASAAAGGAGFTVAVNGSSFASDSVVRWNGSARPTMFVSSTQLTASIPASDITAGGTAEVTVYTTSAPGLGTSAQASFSISDYSLGFAPGSSTISSGQSASYTVTVAPTGGAFDRAVALACSGLPSLASCSFSPATVTPSGSPATSTLTISTTAPKTAMNTFRRHTFLAMWLPLFGVVGLAGGVSRKKSAGLLLLVMALMLLMLLAGCGSNSTTPQPTAVTQPGTPAGTYTVTITGTSGVVTHSGTLTLVVN